MKTLPEQSKILAWEWICQDREGWTNFMAGQSIISKLFLWLPLFICTPKAFFFPTVGTVNWKQGWSDPLKSQVGSKYSVSRQSKCDTKDPDSHREEWVEKYPEVGVKGFGIPLAGDWNEEIKNWWRGRWSPGRPAQGHSLLLSSSVLRLPRPEYPSHTHGVPPWGQGCLSTSLPLTPVLLPTLEYRWKT